MDGGRMVVLDGEGDGISKHDAGASSEPASLSYYHQWSHWRPDTLPSIDKMSLGGRGKGRIQAENHDLFLCS